MKKNSKCFMLATVLVLVPSVVTADVTITVSADKTTVNPGDVVTFTVTSASTTGVIVHRTCNMDDMIVGEGCHEDRDAGPFDSPYCIADGFDGVFEMTVPPAQAPGTYTISFFAEDDNFDSAEGTVDITVVGGPAPSTTSTTTLPPSDSGIIETIGGINNLLYGIAAGIATLMITIHAVKWKTAGSPADREEAKRGIINVILGLIVIIIAAALVSLIYVKPEDVAGPATTTTTSVVFLLIRVKV